MKKEIKKKSKLKIGLVSLLLGMAAFVPEVFAQSITAPVSAAPAASAATSAATTAVGTAASTVASSLPIFAQGAGALGLGGIEQAIKNLTATDNAGKQLQSIIDQRIGEYIVKGNNASAQLTAKAAAGEVRGEPTRYECAGAHMGGPAEKQDALGEKAMDKIALALSSLYKLDESGQPKYLQRLMNASCKLGAVGKERYGDQCKTDAPEKLRDRDFDLTRSILNDPCIPLDPDRVAQELQKIISQDDYTPSDPNDTEALLALISMHRILLVQEQRWGRDATANTLQGLDANSLKAEIMARRYAANKAVLNALNLNACLSSRFFPGCTENEGMVRDYLNRDDLLEVMDAPPPSGYCYSRHQVERAWNVMERVECIEKTLSGTEADRTNAKTGCKRNIADRIADWKNITSEAAIAIDKQPAAASPTSNTRAVGAPKPN